ncbi:hypothetical protein ACLMJK_001103 [Lecanora helva]
MLFTSGLLLAGALFQVADAGASTYSQVQCLTAYGTTKAKTIITKSLAETLTFPVLVKTTYVPSTTVTPAPVTTITTQISTSTVVTTLPQPTDTFSTTTTFFTTTVFTSAESTTTVVNVPTTVLVPGGTTTIPTSSGFIPLASVVAADGGQPRKRKRDQKFRSDLMVREPAPALPPLPAPISKLKCSRPTPGAPQKYPSSVVCNTLYEVVTTKTTTYTATKTATVTAIPVTSTATTFSTITSTSTATVPDASTTTTLSTTNTISTTTTITNTQTDTSSIPVTVSGTPTATAYDACQTNNLISQFNPGQTFVNSYANVQPFPGFIVNQASSAYDCCVQCVEAGSSCGGSIFYSDNPACYLHPTSPDNSVCNGAQEDATLVVGMASNVPYIGTASNGNCGGFNIVQS